MLGLNRVLVGAATAAACLAGPAMAQDASAPVATPELATSATATEAAPAAVPAVPNIIVLKRDTPIVLMAPTEVRSDTAPAGTRFKLRVHESVSVGGRVIIPVGTRAWGEVTAAEKSGGLGKSGMMSARLINIELGDVSIPLDGTNEARGTGAGSSGLAIAFTGVAGLFHRGNNAKIKAGELMGGFVDEDIILDVSGPSLKRLESMPVVAPAPAPVSPAPAL